MTDLINSHLSDEWHVALLIASVWILAGIVVFGITWRYVFRNSTRGQIGMCCAVCLLLPFAAAPTTLVYLAVFGPPPTVKREAEAGMERMGFTRVDT